MWTLSSLFVLLGSAANLFFSLRYPSVAVGPLIALILVHPLGRVWDALLKCDDDPEELFEDGILVKRLRLDGPISIPISSLQSLRLWLAQGRWNEKEHCLVYISASITFGFAFATDVGSLAYLAIPKTSDGQLGHCRTKDVLQSKGPQYHLSAAAYAQYANPGIWICWTHASVSCFTTEHDLARNSRQYGHVHNSSQVRESYSKWMDNLTVEVFLLCLDWCLCLVLSSWSSYASFVLL